MRHRMFLLMDDIVMASCHEVLRFKPVLHPAAIIYGTGQINELPEHINPRPVSYNFMREIAQW